MAEITKTFPKRIINYNGMVLGDINPAEPIEKVLEFHALLHAELTNASAKGPIIDADGTQHYNVEVNIGDDN